MSAPPDTFPAGLYRAAGPRDILDSREQPTLAARMPVSSTHLEAKPVNRVRPRAAAPPYLQLHVRDSVDEAVAEMVKRIQPHLDAIEKIGTPPPFIRHNTPPTASPAVGVLDKFGCPYEARRVTYRLTFADGEEVIVMLPKRADTKETEHIVEELVDAVRSELEPHAFDPETD